MAVQACPACGVINPASAVRCDCGRSFVDGTAGTPLAARMANGPGGSTCPQCKRAVVAQRVTFTWWGGMLGPSLLHHVECSHCHARYNGRTGRPNDTAIAVYLVVTIAVVATVVLLVML